MSGCRNGAVANGNYRAVLRYTLLESIALPVSPTFTLALGRASKHELLDAQQV